MSSKIYFGAGCFWCSEAALKLVPGVVKVMPGYSGGKTKNPTYKDICTGETGHAEVVEVIYDDKKTDFNKLLDIFFTVHDPTTLNRQGNDVGTQYRSIILYTTDEQKTQANNFIKQEQKRYKDKITTEIKKLDIFYPAEKYHEDYFRKNPMQPYCMFVVRPKVKKVEEKLNQNKDITGK